VRRRARHAVASVRPPEFDDDTVETWVSPYELPPDVGTLPAHIASQGLPGEPPEALPYRLLAQTRLWEARQQWAASQPRPPYVPVRNDPRKVWRGPRDEMPPASRTPSPRRSGAGGDYFTCRWRDRDAFLRAVHS
jgi:hypothetical protein